MANSKSRVGCFCKLSYILSASPVVFATSSSLDSSHVSTTMITTSATSTSAFLSSTISSSSAFVAATPSSTLIPEEPEYSFTYPPASSWVDAVVNYKDTVELYWTSTYPFNDPTLSIHCWYRNATANSKSGVVPLNLRRNPDLIRSLGTIGPSDGLTVVNMSNYKVYNPCQFFLVDSVDTSLTRGVVASGGVEILIDDKAVAKNWTVENEAPVSASEESSGAKKMTGCERVLGLVMGWSLVLVAFGMSLM